MSIQDLTRQRVLTAETLPPRLALSRQACRKPISSPSSTAASASLPGVTHAGLTIILPMSGMNSDSSFMIDGRVVDDAHPARTKRSVSSRRIISALSRCRFVKGRFFTARTNSMLRRSSSSTAPSPSVIGLTAKPLGKRMQLPTREGPVWANIVGIVGDLHHRGLDQPVKPEFYVPLLQAPYPSVILAVRSAQDRAPA